MGNIWHTLLQSHSFINNVLCVGFLYKIRMEKEYGIYVVCGMNVLAACFEVASMGTNGDYSPTNEQTNDRRTVRNKWNSEGI